MNTSQPEVLFSMSTGYAPLTNLLGAGDPNVHRIDGRWWMFFGAFRTTLRNNIFAATLAPGEPLHEGMRWRVHTHPSSHRRALPTARPSRRGRVRAARALRRRRPQRRRLRSARATPVLPRAELTHVGRQHVPLLHRHARADTGGLAAPSPARPDRNSAEPERTRPQGGVLRRHVADVVPLDHRRACEG